MTLHKDDILKCVNPNQELNLAARCVAAVMIAGALTLSSCSAIELQQQNATAAALADAQGSTAPTADIAASARAERDQLQLTAQALAVRGTQSAATIVALEATPTDAPTAATAPPQIDPATAADVVVYARIPIDSDRLNSISALAFDSAGHLLVSTRAGEIYRLLEPDEEGALADNELIFADAEETIGQVTGLLARGDTLLLINDGLLSQLQDLDGDGRYETVAQLTTALPLNQSPLLANNSIVQAPDGRLFTADVRSGEILRIILRG